MYLLIFNFRRLISNEDNYFFQQIISAFRCAGRVPTKKPNARSLTTSVTSLIALMRLFNLGNLWHKVYGLAFYFRRYSMHFVNISVFDNNNVNQLTFSALIQLTKCFEFDSSIYFDTFRTF